MPYGSYYAEVPQDCDLCGGDGVVVPVWYRDPTPQEARLLKRQGRPLERIEVRDPQEVCYRCEGTGALKKEWIKRLSLEEARAFVISCRPC